MIITKRDLNAWQILESNWIECLDKNYLTIKYAPRLM